MSQVHEKEGLGTRSKPPSSQVLTHLEPAPRGVSACGYKHHLLHLISGAVRVLCKDHSWDGRGRRHRDKAVAGTRGVRARRGHLRRGGNDYVPPTPPLHNPGHRWGTESVPVAPGQQHCVHTQSTLCTNCALGLESADNADSAS